MSTAISASDSLNAPDLVANKVLPYSNQQVGGTLGGPIVKDKIHYFASYEYEREPGTTFANPSLLPTQTFSIPYQNGQKSFLARVDDQLSPPTGCRCAARAGTGRIPSSCRGRSSVARLGSNQGRDQRARHLVVGDGRRQPHPRDQGRLQRLPLDQRAAGRVARHPRVPRPRSQLRRAVQLSADAEPEQLDRPRRLQRAQGQARSEDRRRVHPRP